MLRIKAALLTYLARKLDLAEQETCCDSPDYLNINPTVTGNLDAGSGTFWIKRYRFEHERKTAGFR
jgi:hypothetical protein